MINLPIAFTERMKQMLGDEFSEFLFSYDSPRLRGLRVNTMKLSPEEFEQIAPFEIQRIPWVENGFFYSNDIYPARHPYYAAGLYYLQEPSAMTPASRLEIREGDRVLDLCAAPGGKATELAAKLNGSSILVANDASNSRSKALLRNLELFGTSSMLVTNEQPERLSEVFPSYFNKILVDAPCSGEGMFRKAPDVIETWSPERVAYFAGLQRTILEHAWRMLCPGGSLLYSTCTFSPEEDEQMMAWFLREHPDMELVPMQWYEGFSAGRPDWADGNPELAKCVRIWPHKMPGEGHFLALLRKREEGVSEAAAQNQNSAVVSDAELDIGADRGGMHGATGSSISEMQRRAQKSGKGGKKGKKAGKKDGRTPGKSNGGTDREEFEAIFRKAQDARLSFEDIERRGDRAYRTTALPPGVRGLHFLRNGLYVGDWKKNRFEPSQPLALALSKDSFPNRMELEPSDDRLQRYLKGETLTTLPEEMVENGWVLVCAGEYPVGWGKAVNGVIKNKFPVSWRGNI